ncbi:MAG: STAS domain-containing protein [Rubripirellula sp.]
MSIAIEDAPASKLPWLANVSERFEYATDTEIIVDLSTVETISSKELSELIRLQLLAKHYGKCLVLKNLHATVKEILTLTRLDRLIELRVDAANLPAVGSPHFS